MRLRKGTRRAKKRYTGPTSRTLKSAIALVLGSLTIEHEVEILIRWGRYREEVELELGCKKHLGKRQHLGDALGVNDFHGDSAGGFNGNFVLSSNCDGADAWRHA